MDVVFSSGHYTDLMFVLAFYNSHLGLFSTVSSGDSLGFLVLSF